MKERKGEKRRGEDKTKEQKLNETQCALYKLDDCPYHTCLLRFGLVSLLSSFLSYSPQTFTCLPWLPGLGGCWIADGLSSRKYFARAVWGGTIRACLMSVSVVNMAPPVRCCRCNGTAKCLRCACVRRGTPCTSCLPGDGGTCHNRPPSPPRGNPSSNTHNGFNTLYPASQPTGPPPPGSFISPASASSQPASPPTSQPTGPLNYPATLNSQPTTVPLSSIPNSQPTTVPLPPISISHPTTAPLPSIPNSQPAAVPLPSILTILQAPIPTLKHIPKRVRDRWARVLGDCLSSICDNPDDFAPWFLVLMVSKCILSSPPLGHRMRWREISKLVKARISRWQAGEFSTLWKEALDGGWSLQKRSKALGPSQQRSNNIRRAKQAVQDGQFSKAIKALTSDGLADHSAAIVQEMLSKHPQAPPPALPPGLVPPSISLNEQAVLRGAKSFPIGSAPGPSGFRPCHLKEAAGCPSPDQAGQFLSRLTRFVNLLAAGRIPPSVTPHLCGATLLASRKKNGGHRPIAVGEVLRRLVSKCLATHTRQTAVSILSPLQLAVGVKGGCEAIVHAVDQALFPSPDNDRWTLLLDLSNAFNSTSWEACSGSSAAGSRASQRGWRYATLSNRSSSSVATPS